MNKVKYTPGPWAVAEKRDGLQIIRNHEQIPIGSVISKQLEKQDRGFANARLIAAAPELLAALQAIANDGERWLNSEDTASDFHGMSAEDLLRSITDTAQAAIHKAEGSE